MELTGATVIVHGARPADAFHKMVAGAQGSMTAGTLSVTGVSATADVADSRATPIALTARDFRDARCIDGGGAAEKKRG